MSEDPSPPQEAPVETAAAAPRVRRISNPRPKKSVAKEAAGGGEPAAEPSSAPAAAAAPADAPTAATVTEAQASVDWPEAETVSEAKNQTANDKRKRRRRKGKGGGQNGQAGGAGPANEEISAVVEPPAPKESAPPVQQSAPQQSRPVQAPVSPQQPQPPRTQINQELLAKRAWKIFLAEVSEEGVSLISDHDARELSKRCFRLAEIFLDEQGRKLR